MAGTGRDEKGASPDGDVDSALGEIPFGYVR
jgi:hypothetical protein